MDTSIFNNRNSQPSPYTSMRALVADEFENSRQSIRQMLITLGVGTVDMTANGRGVIDSCRAHKYDLVLCDFRLGNGKNGHQVLEELRELGLLKSTAIFVIVSAETARDVVMGIMEVGPDEYLSKPFTAGVLSRRLERLFKQNKALEKMKQAQADGNMPVLISLCKEHIAAEGRFSPWCKKALVDAYIAVKKWSFAEKLCLTELESRDLDWAMIGLGKVYAAQGKTDPAITQFEKVLQLFPHAIVAYDLLAECLEKKSKTVEAQKVLDDAIKLSPRIHHRQRKMVEVSLQNGDTTTALKASQSTLKLAANSIHENPDDYIQYVDVIAEASTDLTNSAEKKRYLSDASAALSQLNRRFADDPSVKVRKSLVESRFHAAQGNRPDAQKAYNNAQKTIQESGVSLSMDAQLELGKTLFATGRKDEAERLFSTLVSDQHVDASLKQRINDFLDEPVTPAQRAKAKEHNAVALSAYGKKDYSAAIAAFKEALLSSPSHPGLNLNLVQTCLKLMGAEGEQKYLVNECVEAMQRVRHINPSHRQYTRYESLRKFLNNNYKVAV